MSLELKRLKRLAIAGLVAGAGLAALPAQAAGTAAGTTITNRAVVNYTVGGVAQTQVNSSPTGNSTPGAAGGADTVFVVDRIVSYTLTVVDTTPVAGTPGQTGLATTYLLTNTGNDKEGFALSAANLVGGTVTLGATTNTDVIDMTTATLKVAYGPDATSAYNAGTAVVGNLDNLAADAARRIFVVGDLPAAALNGQGANVRLTAKAAVAGSAGATLETVTAGADTPGSVDVVIAASVLNGTTSQKTADSGYTTTAPSLSVVKTETVISDPVNNTTNPKAIPGAVVEYTVTVTNTGATSANGVAFQDPVAGVLALQQGVYNSGASNVTIAVTGSATRFCLAEAGADANADGCSFASGVLTVNPSTPIAIGSTAPNNVATIKYQVKIN